MLPSHLWTQFCKQPKVDQVVGIVSIIYGVASRWPSTSGGTINPSLMKYFQLIPEASPVSDGIAIYPFSWISCYNCSSLPNLNPTFPCYSGFCLLGGGGHGGGDPLNPKVGSLPLNNFISNIPFYYSHNGDALSGGLLTTKYLHTIVAPLHYNISNKIRILQVTYFDMVQHNSLLKLKGITWMFGMFGNFILIPSCKRQENMVIRCYQHIHFLCSMFFF